MSQDAGDVDDPLKIQDGLHRRVLVQFVDESESCVLAQIAITFPA